MSQDENFKFAFFYDVNDKKIYAQDGKLKDIIASQVNYYNDVSHENLVSRTIKWQTNIIINNFNKKIYLYFIMKLKA